VADPYERLAGCYDEDWGDFAAACLSFLSAVLALDSAPLHIADLACGTGSLALALAKAGHLVLGVDRSSAMLEIARAKSADCRRMRLEQCDLLHWQPTNAFDLVTCMFDSINYLLDLGQVEELFVHVADALQPGATFVFDVNRPSMYARHGAGTIRRVIRGETVLQELHYEPEWRISRTTFRFEDGIVEIHKQRAYELSELIPLLVAAGLEVSERFGGLDLRPLHDGCDRAILVCTRQ